MKEKNDNGGGHALFWGLILAIVFGVFSGVTGDIIFRYYFDEDLKASWLSQEWDLLDNDLNSSRIVIQDAKKVVVSQDAKLAEIYTNVRSGMFGVFTQIEGKKASTTPYNLSEPELSAFAVSSDGWLLAVVASAEAKKLAADIGSLVIIDGSRREYQIDKIIYGSKDYPQIAFIHLKGANNLNVRRLASIDDFSLGQTIVMSDGNSDSFLGYLSQSILLGGLMSSDSDGRTFLVSGTYSSGAYPNFAFNMSGDFLGLVQPDNSLIPAFVIHRLWDTAVTASVLSEPEFGVEYRDLSTDYLSSLGRDKGALVESVLQKSAAASAGIKAGDIITYVDSYEVNASRNLSDIISSYKPGSQVRIMYVRDGAEAEVRAVLSEAK
jgi:S1-C subfamily serine protease